MHTAATWLDLEAQTRAIADCILDRRARRAMVDIAADYERQAQEAYLPLEPARCFGAFSSPIW
jgi:hypothetical protein